MALVLTDRIRGKRIFISSNVSLPGGGEQVRKEARRCRRRMMVAVAPLLEKSKQRFSDKRREMCCIFGGRWVDSSTWREEPPEEETRGRVARRIFYRQMKKGHHRSPWPYSAGVGFGSDGRKTRSYEFAL